MRILIVKIGAIGDAVMSLSMLPFLKERHPNCKITVVCGRIVAPLFKQTNLVDELISVDEKWLLVGNLLKKTVSLFGVWSRLFLRKFDLVLTAHPDYRYRLISLFVIANEKRSWDRFKSPIMPIPGRYHAAEYLRLASGLEHGTVKFPELDIQTSHSLDFPFVVIAPGGARNTLAENSLRRWPIASYAALISKLADQSIQVVVTGADSDSWVRDHLPKCRYIDLIGKLSLLDVIGVFKQSDLLITHDSGPLHLAKLAKCPVLALFGPTNPAEFTSPEESIEVLWGARGLFCRPCYNGKSFASCSSNQCLQLVSVDQVFQKALQKLEASRLPSLV